MILHRGLVQPSFSLANNNSFTLHGAISFLFLIKMEMNQGSLVRSAMPFLTWRSE